MKTSILVPVLTAAALFSTTADAGWRSKALVLGGGWLAESMFAACMASPECSAKGKDFVVAGAQKIIEKYGVVTVGECAASPTCMSAIASAIAMGSTIIPQISGVRPGPGEGIEPPGDCGPGELAKLTAKVEQFCKKARPKKCTSADDLITLYQKVDDLKLCLSARSVRETQCFKGGDRSHRTEIVNTKNQMNTCFERLASKQ